MKSTDPQKQSQASPSRSKQSFFGAQSERSFFSKAKSPAKPFFAAGTPVQAKLTVGAVGDQYEQEADRVAAEVVNRIHSPSPEPAGDQQAVQRMGEDELQMSPLAESIQRVGKEEDELQMKPLQREAMEEDEELQMKPLVQRVGAEGGEVSADFESALNASRGGGQSLAPDLQAKMGQAVGADFSGVRVHTDGRADELNRSVGAQAFTTGQDLFFKRGEYQPGNRGGQELIAHELTHVVQQNGAKGSEIAVLNTVKTSSIGRSPAFIQRFSAKKFNKNPDGYVQAKLEEWSKNPSKGVKSAKTALMILRAMAKGNSTQRSGFSQLGADLSAIEEAIEQIDKWISKQPSASADISYLPDDQIEELISRFDGLIDVFSKVKGNPELMVKNIESHKETFQQLIESASGFVDEVDENAGPEMELMAASAEYSQQVADFGAAEDSEEEAAADTIPFELDMTFASIEISRDKFIGLTKSGSAQKGPLESSYKAKMGADAAASGSASVGLQGISAEASGSIFIGAELTASGQIDLTKGGSGAVLASQVNLKLGLGAEAAAQLGITASGFEAGFEAGAFLGLKADAEATGTLRIFNRDIVAIKGSAEGTLGLGASAEGNIKFKALSGELDLGFGADATVGIGGGASIGSSVNLRNLTLVSIEGADRLRSSGAQGYESLSSIERDQTMAYDAMIAALRKSRSRLESRKAEIDAGDPSAPLLSKT